MARDFAVSFYHSPEWKHTREAYMNMFVPTERGTCPPGMCERCFAAGKLTPAVIIHHIRHLTPYNIGDPNVSLDFGNLKRVCRDCHGKEHSKDDFTPRVAFNDKGEVVRLDG